MEGMRVTQGNGSGTRRSGDAVAESYDAVAGLYIELFGDEELADPRDLGTITAWGGTCDGPVLDAGCGPGHWTAALARRGVEVAGVDLSVEFLEHARRRYPALSFQSVDLRRLPSGNGSWAGVLAWFSLIHLDPVEVQAALAEIHRVLAPGGRVLIGFFVGEGDEPLPFAHKVAPAWAWPVEWVEGQLARAGFKPMAATVRGASGAQRAQGHCEAVRAP